MLLFIVLYLMAVAGTYVIHLKDCTVFCLLDCVCIGWIFASGNVGFSLLLASGDLSANSKKSKSKV